MGTWLLAPLALIVGAACQFLIRLTGAKEAEAELAVRAEAVAAVAASSCGDALPQPLLNLPRSLRRYLERAAFGAQQYTVVKGRQVGEFRLEPTGPWQGMTATQSTSPLVPTFCWTVRCTFKPLMWLTGCDSLVGGKGGMAWRLWGWLPGLAASGPALDRAMLVRWLAETPATPRAMLPSAMLRWEAVPGSDSEARAVLTHQGITVSGTFAFGDDGLVNSFRSDDYIRALPGGGMERLPWVVRYGAHRLLAPTATSCAT